MKMVNLRKARAELSAVVRQSQKSTVCLTVHGRPVAVLTGVDGKALEDVLLSWDPAVWRELDERTRRAARNSATIEEFRNSLKRAPRARAVSARRAHPRTRSG